MSAELIELNAELEVVRQMMDECSNPDDRAELAEQERTLMVLIAELVRK